jgi:hypothetical protein
MEDAGMRNMNLVLGLAAVTALGGCGESFTPGELAGTYGLALVEGNAPPVLELATTECDQLIDDGGLELLADGSHSLNLVILLDCTRGGGQVDMTERTYTGTFSVDGDRVLFTSPQPLGPDLVFEGEARGSFLVDVALPTVTVGLDPFLDVRFDRRRCTISCPLAR